MFGKKTVVERYEQQFKVKEMQNKHIFYDLYARVGDPEELRSSASELLRDLEWKTSFNQTTKFEDDDTEAIFRGGKLKPIRSVLKSYKQFNKGPKFPLAWKLLTVIGIAFIILYFYSLLDISRAWNSTLILQSTVVWFVLAIIIYMIKETVSMGIWIKISGVYNIANEETDVRVVIAGDADKKDAGAFRILEEDVSEIYNSLVRKYVKIKPKPITKTQIIRNVSGKKDPSSKLSKEIIDLNKEISNLSKRLAAGEITEDTYRTAKEELEKRKAKVETMLDILSV